MSTSPQGGNEPAHISKQRKFIRIVLVGLVVYSGALGLLIGETIQVDIDYQYQMNYIWTTDYVTSIALDEGYDLVYIGTASALWIFDILKEVMHGPIKIVNGTTASGVWDVALPSDWARTVYLATDQGLKAIEFESGDFGDILLDSYNIYNVSWAQQYNGTRLKAVEHHPFQNLYFFGGEGLGLAIYDRDSLALTQMNSTNGLTSDWVSSISVGSDRVIAASTGRGFSVLNLTDKSTKVQEIGPNDDYLEVRCTEYYAGEDLVFVGNEDGLFIYKITDDGIEFQKTIGHADGLAGPSVYSMKMDTENHRLYIGTNGGLSFYDIQTDEVVTIEQTTNLDRPFIEAVEVYNYGRSHYIYLGTFDNVFVSINLDFARSTQMGFQTGDLLIPSLVIGAVIAIAVTWKYRGITKSISVGPNDELGGYLVVKDVIWPQCQKFIWVVDTNVDTDTLWFLRDSPRFELKLLLRFIKKGTSEFENLVKRFYRDRPELEVRVLDPLFTHERYIFTEGKGWHLGSSLNRLGSKQTRISELPEHEYKEFVKAYEKDWSKAKRITEEPPEFPP